MATRGVRLPLLIALALGPAAAPHVLAAPARTYDIVDFGAKADGSLSTAALQKAIDACHEAGGGTVLVPPGEFVIGTVRLRSYVNLHLAPGAVLKGSSDLSAYGGAGMGRGLFFAEDVAHVSVTGFGTVDANGTLFHDPDRPTWAWSGTTTCATPGRARTSCTSGSGSRTAPSPSSVGPG